MAVLDADLQAFETGDASARAAVVDGVMRSLATGFVYVAHDLSPVFIDEVYGTLERFFALPEERKRAYRVPDSHGQAGYTGLGIETAASSDVPDWKEMLNWSTPIPEGHPLRARFPHRYLPPELPEQDLPGARALLLEFHDRVLDLQRRFLRIVAVGLGAEERFFDNMLIHGATLTRAIHYPPMVRATEPGQVWAAAHADINLVTALPRATAAGLQVRTAEGWLDVAPPEDRAIVNTGMMLEHLSNGLLPAGVHRVVARPDQAGSRISVVQFCHPTPWTVLAPLPSCITAERPQRFGAISAADRLDEVLYQINLVEGRRRVRE